MTTTLSLLDIRDLLTDWESTPTLNAAKYHEARALYATSDDIFCKRIVPADFARRIQADDPSGQVFFVQFKAIPAALMDHEDFRRWTPTAEYAVLWQAADWPKSTESRLLRVAHLTATSIEHFARAHEADRLSRMAAKIQKRLPALRNLLDILRANAHDEASVRGVVEVFEKALGETIYEHPIEPVHPTQPPSPPAESPGRGPQDAGPEAPAQDGGQEAGAPAY